MEHGNEHIDEFIECPPERISDILFTQVMTEVFCGIEFRAVGWQ